MSDVSSTPKQPKNQWLFLVRHSTKDYCKKKKYIRSVHTVNSEYIYLIKSSCSKGFFGDLFSDEGRGGWGLLLMGFLDFKIGWVRQKK